MGSNCLMRREFSFYENVLGVERGGDCTLWVYWISRFKMTCPWIGHFKMILFHLIFLSLHLFVHVPFILFNPNSMTVLQYSFTCVYKQEKSSLRDCGVWMQVELTVIKTLKWHKVFSGLVFLVVPLSVQYLSRVWLGFGSSAPGV